MAIAGGTRLGPYEILTALGAGGMGEVYRARDTRLGRLVAIKFVSADFRSNTNAASRLEREARLASSLNHPGIVTVYDVGVLDDRPFIVMELIDGESLHACLASGPMPVRDAVEIAAQVADALGAAHDARIVRRDLKPQNIMIAAGRRAKIVDFGLSKMEPQSAGPDDLTVVGDGLTANHGVVGTVGYMAPEQVTGRAVDARADQFALGAVLYEMVSGRRAFKRDTAIQTLAAIVDDEPTRLLEICPAAPPLVVTIVERCLAKAPSSRYVSTLALARDLHEALQGIASGTRSAGAVQPSRRPWRWLAGSVALTLVVVTGIVWQRRGVRVDALVAQAEAVREIVVLPFTTVTKDPGDQELSDGLVETLTSSLTQLERFQHTLRVVPASEVRRERVASAKEARQSFSATLAISGSIQSRPASVRLTLNLIDTVELRQIASRTLDLPLGQDVSAQDTVVTAVASLLDLQLEPDARRALTAGGTAAPAAYGFYLKGRGYLQRFDRVENIDRAIDLLARAVQADDRYALAHAALGEAYWRKYELDRQQSWIDRAVASCGLALKIDERLAPVHVTLALIARGRGRYEEAVASAQRAIELEPVSSEGYRELGRAYEALNRPADAEATYQRAIEARRDDWLAVNTLGAFYLARGRYADAEAAFRRVVQITPDNTRGYNNLGVALFSRHRDEEAASVWERSAAIRPTAAVASNLGTYYFDRGRYADSARAFERAVALTATDYRLWRNLGSALYWAPGEREKARAAYEESARLAELARRVNPRQPELLALLADSYSILGRAREAGEAAAEVEHLAPTDSGVLFTLAGAYEQLGQRAKALTWLEKALSAGYSPDRVERSPGLAGLRKDERYVRLTR